MDKEDRRLPTKQGTVPRMIRPVQDIPVESAIPARIKRREGLESAARSPSESDQSERPPTIASRNISPAVPSIPRRQKSSQVAGTALDVPTVVISSAEHTVTNTVPAPSERIPSRLKISANDCLPTEVLSGTAHEMATSTSIPRRIKLVPAASVSDNPDNAGPSSTMESGSDTRMPVRNQPSQAETLLPNVGLIPRRKRSQPPPFATPSGSAIGNTNPPVPDHSNVDAGSDLHSQSDNPRRHKLDQPQGQGSAPNTVSNTGGHIPQRNQPNLPPSTPAAGMSEENRQRLTSQIGLRMLVGSPPVPDALAAAIDSIIRDDHSILPLSSTELKEVGIGKRIVKHRDEGWSDKIQPRDMKTKDIELDHIQGQSNEKPPISFVGTVI